MALPPHLQGAGAQQQQPAPAQQPADSQDPAAAMAARAAAHGRLWAASDALEQASAADLPACLQEWREADAALSTIMKQQARDVATVARKVGIQDGERPSPLLTALVKPPHSKTAVAALHAPGGRLITHGPAMADCDVRHYAAISAQPVTSAVAEAAVLAELRLQAKPVPPDLAAAAGAPDVSVQELLHAISNTTPGTAPGPDGIPIEIWRVYDNVVPPGEQQPQRLFAPILARLFSAMGSSHQAPPSFLDGVVCALHKSGDRAVIGNYRPITLLNSDYRLLAKCLALRFGKALSAVVSPEQTAFLPGRRISDNNYCTLFLSQVMHAAGYDNSRFSFFMVSTRPQRTH